MDRTFINGFAVSILADGRVKIEGRAPMTRAGADAFLASLAEKPPQPMRPVKRIDYAAEDLAAAVRDGLIKPDAA